MTARSGDTVRVHYKGTLSDGTAFDSSEGREPLEFKLGEGMVIPGFDAAVTGLQVGESVVKTIPANEAYGPMREEMLLRVPKSEFPSDMPLEVGLELQLQGPGGYLPAAVAEFDEESVLLDANHPLAGEDLTFAITLDSIKGGIILA
ncbi:MAG: peptidylprolyl isomerase [Acidobacteria bacterium]|nr:peptidylprolyl isomerase [Acidobacteriota bacterium]